MAPAAAAAAWAGATDHYCDGAGSDAQCPGSASEWQARADDYRVDTARCARARRHVLSVKALLESTLKLASRGDTRSATSCWNGSGAAPALLVSAGRSVLQDPELYKNVWTGPSLQP